MGGQQQHRRHAPQYSHARYTEAHIPYPNEDTAAARPWQHMAQNYAWVTEQEYEKQTKKTNEWILENQIFVEDLRNNQETKRDTFTYKLGGKGSQRKPEAYAWQAEGERWAEIFYAYEIEADMWLREQENARRLALERERAKAKFAQEELRRIEMERQRQRQRAAEKRRTEQRAKYVAAQHDPESQERAQVDKVVVDAWHAYEDRWNTISSSLSSLAFTSIPWPMVTAPAAPTGISSAAIVLFLYSPLHSRTSSRKERIRHAQLRWHPDRFRKVLERVEEQDKQAVEEGVGIVARCLNDLMAREAVASRHQKATM